MLPELVAYELTGEAAERALERRHDAGCSTSPPARGRAISPRPSASSLHILPAVEPAGRLLGEHRGVPVHLVAAHDTACAVRRKPARAGGPRRSSPRARGSSSASSATRRDTSETARAANFSNELGRSRRLPLPEERARLLAARALRLRVGRRDWAGAARARLRQVRTIGRRVRRRQDSVPPPNRMEEEVRRAAGLPAEAPRAGGGVVDRAVDRSRRCVGRGRVANSRPGAGARDRRRRSRRHPLSDARSKKPPESA